jgi:hypothetical protein
MNAANGSNPCSDLVLYNGKFYSTASRGGRNDAGVIFEWDPLTNIYTKKIDLSIADGSNPASSLTLFNGKFYGVT